MLEREGIEAGRLGTVVHGTTLVTNALIERRGAKTALLTTEGFRDAVAIGTEHRYDMYDIFIEKPEPLVPRSLRYGVRERILDDGSVLRELDEEQVRSVAAELEERELGPWRSASCTASATRPTSGGSPRSWPKRRRRSRSRSLRRCRRRSGNTSAPRRRSANVYVRPLVERYLRRLEERLRSALGIRARCTSCSPTAARPAYRRPAVSDPLTGVRPAAGALAAAFYGRESGFPEVLSFDMGGTTAKACVIEDGEPLTSNEFEAARVYRFKKGSGLPVKTSVIEMIEIGAGGGSIARVDALGLPKVGPESAGADPGPACYGGAGGESRP